MKDSKNKVLLLSTYPPRECGIATFTQDILQELKKSEALRPKVVAIRQDEGGHGEDVLFTLQQHGQKDYQAAAETINATGAAALMIEHEYGIFGGDEDKITLIREMLGGGRGLPAKFSNPDSLALQISRVLDDPAAKRRMEQNTLHLGRTMTWPKACAQYADLFKPLCKKPSWVEAS